MKTYIVGPLYDWVFFLGAPVLALVVGIAVAHTHLATDPLVLGAERDTAVGFFTGIIVHAHLVAVVFRSHANASIRRLHPVRFFIVPVVLWIAIVASPWLAIASTVVATFWDVWHSGAQTFGFARIYERNHGTPPELGRRLDFWANQLLYAGPILAGAVLMDHVHSFDDLWSAVPVYVEGHRQLLAVAVIAAGSVFVAFYVFAHVQFARAGHRPSWLKVWIVASTGLVSIYTWGFNSWGQAFLIMNLFHAVQYLALVWVKEGRRLCERAGVAPPIGLALYLGSLLGYGVAVEALDPGRTMLWAITIVVSLMHFWYDAFVWSVRRAEV